MKTNKEAENHGKKVIVCYQHLDVLYSHFNHRFEDILKLNIPKWILNPFSAMNIEKLLRLQEEFTQLSTNEELKFKDLPF